MPTVFVADRARCAWVLSGVLLLALGCAGPRPPAAPASMQSAKFAQAAAVQAGAQALADFRREHAQATAAKRRPDYKAARNDLALAMKTLQPGEGAFPVPEFSETAVCLETALDAMDRIIAAERKRDARAEAVGWAMFDQSAKALLLTLER